VIEGISGLPERLADAGARIGVVSSKKTDYIVLGLDRLDLGSWVDVLVGADDTERHKPDPEPLLYAAGLLDAKPSRCVYVGDAVTDVVAGRAAGMATIAVTWGAAAVHDLAEAGPTAVVSSIAELAEQLLIDARARGRGRYARARDSAGSWISGSPTAVRRVWSLPAIVAAHFLTGDYLPGVCGQHHHLPSEHPTPRLRRPVSQCSTQQHSAGRPGQRLGPNAGGGVERRTGGVTVLRLVAGTAFGVSGPWVGVCGS
jgi:hypothetical protein